MITFEEIKIQVTVHGFRVQKFRVHLKPACERNLTRLG
jgi:hypothetical protein